MVGQVHMHLAHLAGMGDDRQAVRERQIRDLQEFGDAAKAREILPQTLSVIDKIAQKGVIHPNAASRYKSRLAKRVATLQG